MKNMNNEIYLKYLEMVQGDGKTLQYVPSGYQTKELCIEAVKENSSALQYVKKANTRIMFRNCKTKWMVITICKKSDTRNLFRGCKAGWGSFRIC